MTKDNLQVRYAELNKDKNKFIELYIEATLPIMITKSSYLTELTIKSEPSPAVAVADFAITDAEYTADKGAERFDLLTVAKSPITGNRAVFFYDKLFEDIIVLPNTDFLDVIPTGFKVQLRGFRIGSGMQLDKKQPHQVLSNVEKYCCKLPATKTNIAVKSHLVMVPGMVPEHIVRNDLVERKIDNDNTLCYTVVQPSVIVDLGNAASVFNTAPASLPLYLLAQHSLREYNLLYINNIDPGTNNLLISLTF